MAKEINVFDFRHPEQEINRLLVERWSPRALTGEPIKEEDLLALLEAAKWAPSAFNEQPWRFIYAKNNTPAWEKIFSTLSDFNKTWVNRAAVLILIISRRTSTRNGQELITASFDTGAAHENLALEATSRGLVSHTMSGFDFAQLRANLEIPELYKLEALVAVGVAGDKADLPPELATREEPSLRRPLKEIISEGKFNFEL